MATAELGHERIALIPLAWGERWRAWREARHQARLDRADVRRQAQVARLSEREIRLIERRLSGELRRDMRRYARRIVDRLTELELAYYAKGEHRGRISKVRFAEGHVTPAAVYLRVDTVHLPRGVRTSSFEEVQILQDLSLACQAPVQTFRHVEKGFWFVVERTAGLASVPSFVEYVDALAQMPTSSGPLDIPIGVGSNRKFYHAEIEMMPHLLIAGATGYGKSVMLHNIICTIAQRARPDQVRLVICDLKGGAELGIYADLPHLLEIGDAGEDDDPGNDGSEPGAVLLETPSGELRKKRRRQAVIEPRIYNRRQDVEPILRRLYYEVERRLQMFTREKVRDINGWNFHHRGTRRLPRIVFICDEIANVMLDRKCKDEVERLLADIAARGRAPGVHLVIATQRPSVDVITGLIKANFPTRMAFNTASQVDSRVIIDTSDAAGLGVPGRLLYTSEDKRYQAQSPFLSEALVSDVVQRVIAGEITTEIAHHSVGKMDMAQWAIEHNDYRFSVDEIYVKFRGRGVTHRDVRTVAAELTGVIVDIGGKFYRLESGRGPHARQFVEVKNE
jgi:hypothetical protein